MELFLFWTSLFCSIIFLLSNVTLFTDFFKKEKKNVRMLYNIYHAPISSGLCIIADKHGIWISITHNIHLPLPWSAELQRKFPQIIPRTVQPVHYPQYDQLSAPVKIISKWWKEQMMTQNVYPLENMIQYFLYFQPTAELCLTFN